MKIDKAIEILLEEATQHARCGNKDVEEAALLGIEALKRVKETRTDYGVVLDMPLPGEEA